MLRETREQRGLDLVTVHDRLGRPITQLEGLESGDLRSMPDQAMALSTLRRYAAFLTLDGDALALQLMEAWSSAPPANGRRRMRDNGGLTGVMAAVTSGPEHLRAFTQTGQVPRVAGFATSTAGAGSGAYGYGVAVGPPTGMIPAIAASDFKDAKRAMARARRRRRAATPLKVATWLVAVLALAAVAGTVIQSAQPQWFVESHILRVTAPGGGPLPPAPTAATTAPAHPKADPVVLATTDGSTFGQYTVASQHFTVKLAASDVCWVQVIDASSATPQLQGDMQAGQEQSFTANKSITVEVGSAAVVVGIFINGKAVFLNTPANTPYTYTFTSTTS
ncbi:MAG TPA: helix-turn-helix domain-containing protein [Acidimicrobiales bacterium]|nr:helix-turn-helix domain-containing protein [Acidimicrobiales bacterium]